jgi:hypothetical protein
LFSRRFDIYAKDKEKEFTTPGTEWDEYTKLENPEKDVPVACNGDDQGGTLLPGGQLKHGVPHEADVRIPLPPGELGDGNSQN